ncbi:MAG: glycosyltransferase [Christensenellales bacterium]
MIFGQFNDSFPPMIDGVANVAINYCSILNEDYGSCYMVTPRYPATGRRYPFEIMSFQSYAVPFRKDYRWGLGRFDAPFWNKLSKVPFDIVHAHSPFSTGLIAGSIAREKKIPLVATLHSKYKDDFIQVIKSEKLVNSLVIKQIVRFYEKADDVWTVSDSSVDILREYGYAKDVFVMRNGSDIPITGRSPEVKADIVRRYHLNADAPVFVFVGQHIPQKNIALIIEALHIIHLLGYPFNMLFIGDGPARLKYQTVIKEKQLDSKVQFTGVIRDREELKKIYTSSDAVLFPSLYDTSSLVPREASACSCPTVFIAGSTTSQGVIDGKNGFLAKNDPRDYAEKIRQIITTPGLACSAGCGALDTLYISWKDIVKSVYERYLYLIEKHKAEAVRH